MCVREDDEIIPLIEHKFEKRDNYIDKHITQYKTGLSALDIWIEKSTKLELAERDKKNKLTNF